MRTSLAICTALALAACQRVPAPSPTPPETVEQSAPVHDELLEQLKREATTRPIETPSVETILAAFEKAGLVVARKQQVLGASLGAHYCSIAIFQGGLNVSLCEFDTEVLAKAGREASLKLIPAGPRRDLRIVKKTLGTFFLPSDDPAIRAQRDQAEKIFNTLAAK